MAQTPLTGLLTGSSTPLLASGDIIAFVDVSDSTQSPSGSLVKGTQAQFFAALNVPVNITSASATAFAVGLAGATNSAFLVDASTALQAAGLKITGAVAAGTVAVVVTSSGADASLSINAKGTGTIGIGSVSTGRVTITPACTITGALMISSTLTGGASSDIAINTNKFTVAASTGNTLIAGTVAVASDFAVATNKFTVTASSGSFISAGTGKVATTIGVGNATAAATGQGVTFADTPNPSSDANTLDYYKRTQSWTPVLATPGTATYTTQTGTCTKFGRMVWVEGVLKINNIGSGVGTTVGGLLFTAANNGMEGTIALHQWDGVVGNYVYVAGRVVPNTTTIKFNTLTGGSSTMSGDTSILTSTSEIRFSGWYEAAS